MVAASKSARALAIETVRTLPRLARLGQINDHTRISLGRIMSEQARGRPDGEFLLFDGRVHTYEAVDRRINNVVRGLIEVGVRQGAHVGVLMETRPSALVAIAALSRLGAVAVLMPPDADLAERGPPRRRYPTSSPTRPISTPPAGSHARAGARRRREPRPASGRKGDADVIDMEKINPDVVELPGWYRPNPGYAQDLAYVAFATVGGELVARQITNFRWALSAFGTASAANLGRGDTVYRLTPLHHQSGLLVGLGGAVDRRCPHRAVPRACVPTASSTKSGSTASPSGRTPGRCCVTSSTIRRSSLNGNSPGALVHRLGHAHRAVEPCRTRRSNPRTFVEFFATTDGQAVLANVAGPQDRQRGRPLPGGGRDRAGRLRRRRRPDPRGRPRFRASAEPNEVGVLLADPRGPGRPDGVGQARRVRAGRHLGVHRVSCSGGTRTATTGWSTTAARSSAPRAARCSPSAVERRRRPARRGGPGGHLRACQVDGRDAGRHRAGAAPGRQRARRPI